MDLVPTRGGDPVAGIDSLSPTAPWRVVNVGNGRPRAMMTFVRALERATGHEARVEMLPMQAGDVEATWADTSLLTHLAGPGRQTDMGLGTRRCVDWLRDCHGLGQTGPLPPPARLMTGSS